MSRYRLCLWTGTIILLVACLCEVLLPGTKAWAGPHSGTRPAPQARSGVSSPTIVPLTDEQQRALLIQKYGPTAKQFKIMHYSDSWIDHSQTLTAYQTSYSPNWAGYEASVLPTRYYAYHVAVTFTVPAVNTNRTPAISEWAGIGGVFNSKALIQAGAFTTLHDGYPAIAAFFELYNPSAQKNNPVALWVVYPGETVTVGIDQTNNASGDWQIYVRDSSNMAEVIPVQGFYPDQNTAEWIQERSLDSLTPSDIPWNAAPVYYTVATWGDQYSGTARSIQDSEVGVVVRDLLRNAPPNGGNECLVPDNLSSTAGASSFNTVWESSC